jgi:MoaA/NifB/PqqE/SkfB family radical SAM enzyme
MNKKKPIPGVEWDITGVCNYSCEYCNPKKGGHCPDEKIEKVLMFFKTLKGTWLIKPMGGEPTLHPQFLHICKRIVESGHNLCLTTNFSSSIEKYLELANICQERLEFLTVSYHYDQIKDKNKFLEKLIRFNLNKNKNTQFSINSVLTEQNFHRLKKIERQLKENNLDFSYQILKQKKKFLNYSNEIENYVSGKTMKNADAIRNFKSFGTFCYTGNIFFKIKLNGNVNRCYSRQKFFYLGNIFDGSFKPFHTLRPCLSKKCTCVVPANRNLICFGEKAGFFQMLHHYFFGSMRAASILRGRIIRKIKKP